MRLINTETLEFREFPGDNVPPYVILSHTWTENEYTFKDFERKFPPNFGYSKIIYCGRKAKHHGFQYMWIDTCCIDKSSSAELSEAINSMYQWYKNASICYAYLEDVPSEDDISSANSHFRRSRWFTRGWTLQELIAPSNIIFYSRSWRKLGYKTTICDLLSKITKIGPLVLLGKSLNEYSIATRMSWAAGRRTTRPEDVAYCLLGIFEVNMPLLYGEGQKAFIRLQEAILKESDDQSLFAWAAESGDLCAMENFEDFDLKPCEPLSGLFANSPDDFANSSGIFAGDRVQGISDVPSYLTNKGLCVPLTLTQYFCYGIHEVHLAMFNCFTVSRDGLRRRIAALFSKVEQRGNQYARIRRNLLLLVDDQDNWHKHQQVNSPTTQVVYVRQSPRYPLFFQFSLRPVQDNTIKLLEMYPADRLRPGQTSLLRCGSPVIEKIMKVGVFRISYQSTYINIFFGVHWPFETDSEWFHMAIEPNQYNLAARFREFQVPTLLDKHSEMKRNRICTKFRSKCTRKIRLPEYGITITADRGLRRLMRKSDGSDELWTEFHINSTGSTTFSESSVVRRLSLC
jgi:Heterokaryon incompatibility protein (HET)